MKAHPDRVNFNPNAECSRLLERVFDSCITTGLEVSIIDTDDKEGIWLTKWKFSAAKPLPDFRLIQRKRGQGDAVGGYLKKELLERFEVGAQEKCLVREEGSLLAGTARVKLLLKDSKKIPASRDTALVSFDPKYSPSI